MVRRWFETTIQSGYLTPTSPSDSTLPPSREAVAQMLRATWPRGSGGLAEAPVSWIGDPQTLPAPDPLR